LLQPSATYCTKVATIGNHQQPSATWVADGCNKIRLLMVADGCRWLQPLPFP